MFYGLFDDSNYVKNYVKKRILFFIMNKFKQSAIEVLKKVNKPLHYTEITRLTLESGILET